MSKAIVLPGGGVLCAAQPAMLQGLMNRDKIVLEEYTVFAGTSAGSMNALCLTIGMEIDHLVDLWQSIKEEEIMPKVWWSVFRGKRRNLIGKFVRERILKPNGYDTEITCKQLHDKTGKEFYAIATVLQNNKGIVFGHDWQDISVADACMYSVSHPLAFDSQSITINNITYDLTDGGVIQNAPVSLLIGRKDVTDVLCIDMANSFCTTERFTNFMSVIGRILSGTSNRNEALSYYIGFKTWGEKFKLWSCQFDKEVDIFDVKEIPYIMHIARVAGHVDDEQSIGAWLPAGKITAKIAESVMTCESFI